MRAHERDPSPRNRTLLRNRGSEAFIYLILNPLVGSTNEKWFNPETRN